MPDFKAWKSIAFVFSPLPLLALGFCQHAYRVWLGSNSLRKSGRAPRQPLTDRSIETHASKHPSVAMKLSLSVFLHTSLGWPGFDFCGLTALPFVGYITIFIAYTPPNHHTSRPSITAPHPRSSLFDHRPGMTNYYGKASYWDDRYTK